MATFSWQRSIDCCGQPNDMLHLRSSSFCNMIRHRCCWMMSSCNLWQGPSASNPEHRQAVPVGKKPYLRNQYTYFKDNMDNALRDLEQNMGVTQSTTLQRLKNMRAALPNQEDAKVSSQTNIPLMHSPMQHTQRLSSLETKINQSLEWVKWKYDSPSVLNNEMTEAYTNHQSYLNTDQPKCNDSVPLMSIHPAYMVLVWSKLVPSSLGNTGNLERHLFDLANIIYRLNALFEQRHEDSLGSMSQNSGQRDENSTHLAITHQLLKLNTQSIFSLISVALKNGSVIQYWLDQEAHKCFAHNSSTNELQLLPYFWQQALTDEHFQFWTKLIDYRHASLLRNSAACVLYLLGKDENHPLCELTQQLATQLAYIFTLVDDYCCLQYCDASSSPLHQRSPLSPYGYLTFFMRLPVLLHLKQAFNDADQLSQLKLVTRPDQLMDKVR